MLSVDNEQVVESRKAWTAPKLEQIEMRDTQQIKVTSFECPALPVGLTPGSPFVCNAVS